MRGIDAHDEFAFWVIQQVQLHLAALSRRRRLEPSAFTSPLVEALSQLQRTVAQGHKGLGWFDRQELGHHLRRLAIRQEAAQTCGALHQFRRRLIRADIAQDGPGVTKMRQTALAVHDPRISNLKAAEHRPDLALAAILDPSEPLAIHAETARQDVSLALLVDDHREPDLASRQALQILVDRQFRTMSRPELVRALQRNFP